MNILHSIGYAIGFTMIAMLTLTVTRNKEKEMTNSEANVIVIISVLFGVAIFFITL